MAKYGSGSITIEFDNSGGTLVNMSNYILEASEVSVEGLFEDSTAFGDTWKENLPVAMRMVPEITLSFFFDDTATTGPDAIFNAVASTTSTTSRTLKVTWGTNTTSVECFIKKYTRQPVRESLTKANVVLLPTGAVTEA